MSCVGTLRVFWSILNFYVFWMYFMLRLISENLSTLAVKISFLLGRKHGVCTAQSFVTSVMLWYIRNNMQKFTSIILNMTTICIAQWLSDTKFKILHSSDVFTCCQNFGKHESVFIQTHVEFLLQKYEVICQLRHSYACVMLLKSWMKFE